MTDRIIKVTELGQAAWPGRYIAAPDSDYPYGSIVPATDYLWDEQDWQHVISRRGHADIGELTLAYHDGSQHVEVGQQWSSLVWLLCDANGEPIEQDPNDD